MVKEYEMTKRDRENPDSQVSGTEVNLDCSKSGKTDANILIGTGVGVGGYGAVLAAATGTICTACLIFAPALIGVGIYKRSKAKD